MELHVTKRKGRKIVVLLDNDMRIVKPVYDYLKYQDQRDRAINTLIAYGNDLKAFWEFLSEFGYTYDEVSPKMIGEYKEYLMSEDDNIIAINKEGARTAKTINRMLSTLHGFYQYQADMQEIDKPVTEGNICPRLLKRQKCYTCSRYITTPEYLDAHKRHLANLEKQLEEGVIYGEHYAEHFIPTIEVLKVIIERLEGLQNGN